MGMKLFPLYSEKMKVDQALSKLEQTKDAVRMSKTDIVKSVMRQFEVSDVDRWGTQEFTKLLDVKNLKGGKGKIVSLEYEIRVPFFSNLDVVMNYNRSVTLTKSLSE
jgi:hypothetical protein